MIQKFSAISSHLYNCHYQSGINTATISNDSLIEGYFVFLGVFTYTPPSFKKHNLVLCQFGFRLLILFVQLF